MFKVQINPSISSPYLVSKWPFSSVNSFVDSEWKEIHVQMSVISSEAKYVQTVLFVRKDGSEAQYSGLEFSGLAPDQVRAVMALLGQAKEQIEHCAQEHAVLRDPRALTLREPVKVNKSGGYPVYSWASSRLEGRYLGGKVKAHPLHGQLSGKLRIEFQ